MSYSNFNFLIPKYCISCDIYGKFLCDICKNSLTLTLPSCYICGNISDRGWIHNRCLKNDIERGYSNWKFTNIAQNLNRKIFSNSAHSVVTYMSEMVDTTRFDDIFREIRCVENREYSFKYGFNPDYFVYKSLRGRIRIDPDSNKVLYIEYISSGLDLRYRKRIVGDDVEMFSIFSTASNIYRNKFINMM